MATLVAIAYPGEPDRAAVAAKDLEDLPFAVSADLDDAVAVVVSKNGKVHLLQSTNLTTLGALDGALVWLVTGVVLTFPFPFLAPITLTGAALSATAIGALTGGVIGHFSDIGIDDEFVRQLSEKLPAESSALFVLVEGDNVAQVLEQLTACGGELLTTDLPAEQAAKLRAALHKEHEAESV